VLRSTPATTKAAKQLIRKGSGRPISTPATRAHHPTTAHTTRKDGSMRDSSADYFEQDESTEFIPMMYGLGSHGANRGLYNQVHSLVKSRLPIALKKAGVHPSSLAKIFKKPGPMRGLGDDAVPASTTSSAAQSITSAIMGVVDPADAAAVSKAVNAGITAIVGAAPAPSSSLSLNLGGWGVPLLVLAGILGIGMFMAKPKRTIKYRRNPSRRGGRRRSSRKGGGSGIGKYVPWLLAGGAAYMIFTPKSVPAGAPAGTQPTSLLQSALNLFKPSPTGAPSAVASESWRTRSLPSLKNVRRVWLRSVWPGRGARSAKYTMFPPSSPPLYSCSPPELSTQVWYQRPREVS
jgi:hypothetical protein